MIKVGIVGGAGYTAGELIRILVNHPDVCIAFVHSSSNAGKAITDVHCGLLGDIDLVFTSEMNLSTCDVIFLCMGHGQSSVFMKEHVLPDHLKVIDLSQDFRLHGAHDFVYGLPELNREAIKAAHYIANPGCFATAIQLCLLPLAQAHLLNGEVHVNGTTGSTGAGQKPTATTHFSWRNNNVSAYKAFEHQHLHEIGETVLHLQPDFDYAINFIPMRGNFSRGIFVSAYIDCTLSLEAIQTLYQQFYDLHPFVVVSTKEIDLKEVVNTNKGVIHVAKHNGKLLVTCSIDNLLKGASGQAVQNMNLIFGLNETSGLKLKSIAF